MTKQTRCDWVPKENPLYVTYHDMEWGVPVFDDRKIFELLLLESAQAGLSWLTVLRKREHYRKVFADFDPKVVAKFTDYDIENLLLDPGIIRNRAKVKAAINNAGRFLEVAEKFGTFSGYIWEFVGGQPKINAWKEIGEVPTTSPEAIELSTDLRKRGFAFLGPTVIYAHMQATGMVNDHLTSCFRYREVSTRDL